MAKRCPNCNVQFTLKDMNNEKNIEVIKCPSCRRKLIESGKSKVIVLLLVLVPALAFTSFIKILWLKLICVFGWAFFVNVIIRPMISKYNLEES